MVALKRAGYGRWISVYIYSCGCLYLEIKKYIVYLLYWVEYRGHWTLVDIQLFDLVSCSGSSIAIWYILQCSPEKPHLWDTLQGRLPKTGVDLVQWLNFGRLKRPTHWLDEYCSFCCRSFWWCDRRTAASWPARPRRIQKAAQSLPKLV